MLNINILQVILVIITFITIKYLGYKITEDWGLPRWLNYQPYNCFKCLVFWLLMGFYVVGGITLNWWYYLSVGAIITVLDVIALIHHQKNNTINLEDYEYDK